MNPYWILVITAVVAAPFAINNLAGGGALGDPPAAAPEHKWWYSDLRNTERWNVCSDMLKIVEAECNDGAVLHSLECANVFIQYDSGCAWHQSEIIAENERRAESEAQRQAAEEKAYWESPVGQEELRRAAQEEAAAAERAASVAACHDAWEAVQMAPAGYDGLLDLIDAASDACTACAWRDGAPDCNTQDAAVNDTPPANYSPDRGIIP